MAAKERGTTDYDLFANAVCCELGWQQIETEPAAYVRPAAGASAASGQEKPFPAPLPYPDALARYVDDLKLYAENDAAEKYFKDLTSVTIADETDDIINQSSTKQHFTSITDFLQ